MPQQVVVVRPINHLFHWIVVLLTGGLWLPFYGWMVFRRSLQR